jgi:hypothetical protein
MSRVFHSFMVNNLAAMDRSLGTALQTKAIIHDQGNIIDNSKKMSTNIRHLSSNGEGGPLQGHAVFQNVL